MTSIAHPDHQNFPHDKGGEETLFTPTTYMTLGHIIAPLTISQRSIILFPFVNSAAHHLIFDSCGNAGRPLQWPASLKSGVMPVSRVILGKGSLVCREKSARMPLDWMIREVAWGFKTLRSVLWTPISVEVGLIGFLKTEELLSTPKWRGTN